MWKNGRKSAVTDQLLRFLQKLLGVNVGSFSFAEKLKP